METAGKGGLQREIMKARRRQISREQRGTEVPRRFEMKLLEGKEA